LNAHVNLDAAKFVHGYPIRTGRPAVWSTVELPAVRSMFYDLTGAIKTDDADAFSRLGPKLTDIQLGFLKKYPLDIRVSRLILAFALIRAACTCLTQVVLAVLSWSILGLYTPTLPSTVHTLGIRVMDTQVSAANVKRLFNALLPSYVACNPSLKTIKFIEARNIRICALMQCRCGMDYASWRTWGSP
jgi:hypothetical protein